MTKVAPKTRVDSIGDFSVFLVIGLLQLSILFGLPGYATYLATGYEISGYGMAAALYLVFLSFSVLSISIGKEGIELHRWLGYPKRLTWGQIGGFQEVAAKEVVLLGWLWPLFPPRESTPCMSCQGHFRVDFDSGFFYYPPSDAVSFVDLMEENGARRL